MNEGLAPDPSAVPRIRAVILDYGNVLCNPPATEQMRPMADILHVEAEDFLEFYGRSRGPYDRGDLTPTAYWSNLARSIGVQLSNELIENLRQMDTRMWSSVNPVMVDWAGRLRASGFKTAILSNMEWDMVVYLRTSCSWLDNFDCQTFSCETRSIKPDEAIYRHCLLSLGVPPGEALFIDDRDENVEAARKVGLKAIRFESADQVRATLEKTDFPILPTVARGTNESDARF